MRLLRQKQCPPQQKHLAPYCKAVSFWKSKDFLMSLSQTIVFELTASLRKTFSFNHLPPFHLSVFHAILIFSYHRLIRYPTQYGSKADEFPSIPKKLRPIILAAAFFVSKFT